LHDIPSAGCGTSRPGVITHVFVCFQFNPELKNLPHCLSFSRLQLYLQGEMGCPDA
jgi:hypothetical protein